MKWLLRIFIALLLLLTLLSAAAWLSFPWYAQPLLDRALKGTPLRIEVTDIAPPAISGIGFRSIKILFVKLPDNCTDEATTYTILLNNGSIAWNLESRDGGILPKAIDATFTLKADSLTLLPDPQEFTFVDQNPKMAVKVSITRDGFGLSLKPDSATYSVEGAAVTREKLRLEGVEYKVRLTAAEKWQQPKEQLRVAKLFSEGNPLPVSNFQALFGSARDPLKPCTLSLNDCSFELMQWRASSERIDYNLKEKSASFTLALNKIPLGELPGLKHGPNSPIATGEISGSIPVEFQYPTLKIRNGWITASRGSQITFSNNDRKPLLSLDMAGEKGSGRELLKGVNATVTLNTLNKKSPGFTLSDLSATLLGGKVSSTPFLYNPLTSKRVLTIRFNNIKALERIRLRGEFKGTLNGVVNGTIPLSMAGNLFAVNNAQVQFSGGGNITVTPPAKKVEGSQSMFSTEQPASSYTFSEPSLLLNRTENGNLSVGFTLKEMKRKSGDGELALLSPKGEIGIGQNPKSPGLVTLSDFRAGVFDGTISLHRLEYDMTKKAGETTLQVHNIPLQKLLDLQGSKKIYATGNVKGSIPIKITGQLFEIKNGTLSSEQSGQIIYATTPEERAAANQGLRTTYEALSNFLYIQLFSTISMAPDGKSVISVQLNGKNPDFQSGRAIELNINVEQNLQDLMRTLSISSNIDQIISEKALQNQKK